MGEALINSYNQVSNHNIRERQEQLKKERKRNILHLIHSYLLENNLENTAERLVAEAFISPTIEVCDNVDLDTIMQEYTSYYFTKFGKYPKICKKASENVEIKKKKPETKCKSKPTLTAPPPSEVNIKNSNFEIDVKSLSVSYGTENNAGILHSRALGDGPLIRTKTISLQPLENIKDYPGDWKEMYELISKEIVPKNLNIGWSNCIGLDNTISLLQEAVIFPLEYPEFFLDVSPWKGILLYGPPGTGKTLLAKALACEANTIFINVTASTFISKWRGESEKLIRVLFEIAKHNSPCTIFIDELDALSSRREEKQHEASRRFKSELLTQMDGILNSNDKIFILATSNIPWEIDSAILRRFDKKILVDLPNLDSRIKMFKMYLHLKHTENFQETDYNKFASLTENFSGNDIKLICKNALMSSVRKRIASYKKIGNNQKNIYYLVNPSVNEVHEAIKNARAQPMCMKEKFLNWQANYGGV